VQCYEKVVPVVFKHKNHGIDILVWMWELDYKESWALKNWCFWTVVLEKTLESPLAARRSKQSILKEINPGCSLATWCKELTHWKRPWCWERLKAGGEGDDRGWDSWMASPTQWTWVWVNSGSWWCREAWPAAVHGGWQRVGHNWATELNWTETLKWYVQMVRIQWRRYNME